MNNIYTILEKKLGSKVKEYRDKWNKAGKDGYIPEYPLHLNFELTFGCNLKCDFCIHSIPLSEWSYKVDPTKQISFEKYKEIIDEGIKKGLCSVSLNGNNEPLLKKDIDKYIRYAVDNGIIEISLHTNGYILSKEISKNIIKSGLTTIMFSVDAYSKEVYGKIRKNGNYKKTINNILNFIEIKKNSNFDFPLIQVSFVRNKINIDELNKFVKFWKNKVDNVEVQSFRNLFINHYSYNKIQKKYYLEDDFFTNCYDPYRRVSIQNNGNVFPCCSTYGNEIIIGNIYKNSIYEIWNNEKIKNIRKKIKDNEKEQPYACKKCRLSAIRGLE